MNGEAYEFFYFTRHGETEWNVKKKIQGTTDIPLDEKGIQQAKRLAETLLEKQRNGELHLDRVYTSPQLRAAETARFFRGGAGHRLHPALGSARDGSGRLGRQELG